MINADNEPDTQPGDPKRETMSDSMGHTITVAAFLLPALVIGLIASMFGNANTAIGLAILWPGLLFGKAVKFRRKRTFLVVERFGYLWRIYFGGFCPIIPFIDNPVLDGNFLQQQVPLFEEGSGDDKKLTAIDFTDGLSPSIVASAWYQVGNPDDLENGMWDNLREQVLKYAYIVRADEQKSRVAEMFQNAFLRRLETKTYAEARGQMEEIAMEAVEAAREPLSVIGVYPFPKKGIVVKDINLPPEIIALREQVMRGEMDAKEAINRSRAFWEPLAQMRKGLDSEGFKFTDKELLDFFTTQKGFEVLARVGKLDMVAPGIDGALKTFNVGSTAA